MLCLGKKLACGKTPQCECGPEETNLFMEGTLWSFTFCVFTQNVFKATDSRRKQGPLSCNYPSWPQGSLFSKWYMVSLIA